jgi:hypothetical protein
MVLHPPESEMKSHCGSLVVLLSALVLAQGARAQLVDTTWNSIFGRWDNPGNWTPSLVPNNTNGVRYAATVNSGIALVSTHILLDTLNFNSGIIVGLGSITVTNSLLFEGTSGRVLGVTELDLPTGSQSLWTSGNISIWGTTKIVNAGTFTVVATTDLTLTIDPSHPPPSPNPNLGGTFVNAVGGVFSMSGPSQLTVGSAFNNAGLFIQNSGSIVFDGSIVNTGTFQQNSGTITMNGLFVQTSGNFYVGNGAVLSGDLAFDGGRLGGTGTVGPDRNLSITSGAVLDPGNGPGTAGRLTITDKLILAGGGVLHADIGGTNDGVTYDEVVTENSPSVKGGVLQISLINGFIPRFNDTFAILVTSDASSVRGSFVNVADGLRLFTTDDDGSFLVLYGSRPNEGEVVLTDFVSTPEPSMTALLAASAGCRLVIRRRRAASQSGNG